MFGLKTKKQVEFDRHWQGTLSDYVTSISWSPDGKTLAVSSAAGEVVVYQGAGQGAGTLQETLLQAVNGRSVD